MRENLVSIRKKARLTQTELAFQLGVSDRHYQSLEAGTSDGSIKVWQALSKMFGKTIDYLLVNKNSSNSHFNTNAKDTTNMMNHPNNTTPHCEGQEK